MYVHIAISTYRGMGQDAMGAIRVAEDRLRAEPGFTVDSPTYYGSALLARSRNDVLSRILREMPEVDKVVFIDDDMQPEPEALVKLCKHDAPIVSALCTTRIPPVELACKMWDPQTEQFWQMDSVPKYHPTTGPYAPGAAFLAVSREGAMKLVEHYLRADDWIADNARLFDRLHVRKERREAERAAKEKQRRELWDLVGFLVLFETKQVDNGQDAGEDVIFALRCIQAGVPVVIDPRIVVGHLGNFPYGPWLYKPQNTDSSVDRLREAGLIGAATKVA